MQDVNAVVKGDDYKLTIHGDVNGGVLKTATNADTDVKGNINQAYTVNGFDNGGDNGGQGNFLIKSLT